MSCWPSTTLMPSRCSANRMGGSTTSMPTGSLCRPRISSSILIFLATSSARPISGDIAPRSSEMPGRERSPEPRAIELMVLGGRAEVPQNRLVILRQQREAADLVLRPGADVRRGDVAHVVHVEAQQRAHLGFREQRFDARQTLARAGDPCRCAAPNPLPWFREFSVPLVCLPISNQLVCDLAAASSTGFPWGVCRYASAQSCLRFKSAARSVKPFAAAKRSSADSQCS